MITSEWTTRSICTMVARGKARVRVIVSASFSQDDCDAGLAAFGRVKAELIP